LPFAIVTHALNGAAVLTQGTLSRKTRERRRCICSSSQCCCWFSETKQFNQRHNYKKLSCRRGPRDASCHWIFR